MVRGTGCTRKRTRRKKLHRRYRKIDIIANTTTKEWNGGWERLRTSGRRDEGGREKPSKWGKAKLMSKDQETNFKLIILTLNILKFFHHQTCNVNRYKIYEWGLLTRKMQKHNIDELLKIQHAEWDNDMDR